MPQDQLEAIVSSEKNAGYKETKWTEARMPDGKLLQARLLFGVTCNGEQLTVHAIWKGAGDQQIFMQYSAHPSANIVRLCLSCKNHAEPHWHYYEYFAGVPEQKKPCDAGNTGKMDDLVMHFVEEQKIRNLNHPGSLL